LFMPALRPRHLAFAFAVVSIASAARADDLHLKRTLSVEGNAVSSSEVWIKGARERSVTNSPTGTTVTLRQCDLKRTVTLNDQTQAYMVAGDPQDDAALKAAALMGGGSAPAPAPAGGTVTQTTTITDTGERKTMLGFPARHLKMSVSVEPSQGACSQVSQKYEIDGWYADVNKDLASCQAFLPPVRQTDGCSDRIVSHHSGAGRPGYPLSQTITFHNPDASTMKVDIATTAMPKQVLEADKFDVPSSYRQVNSLMELSTAAQAVQPAAAYSPMNSQQQQMQGNNMGQPAGSQMANMGMGMAGSMMGQKAGGMMAQAGQLGGMGQMGNGMAGPGGAPQGAPMPLPQALGPKAPGKIRIGVAPAQAQLGQGNDAQNDYGTPVRNSIIYLMNGPSVEIAALDSRLPMQVQAEAQQKQCDYILMSGVTIKHSGSGGFGKFMKAGNLAASMTPIGMMAHSAGAIAATQAATMATQAATQMATQAAMQAAEQAAKGQLSGLNGQVKNKDDVTVEYQLYPTGQNNAVLANTLKGKAKTDGEDVLTPLIQQAANSVLTQVTKK
jgi:hypothetical protein